MADVVGIVLGCCGRQLVDNGDVVLNGGPLIPNHHDIRVGQIMNEVLLIVPNDALHSRPEFGLVLLVQTVDGLSCGGVCAILAWSIRPACFPRIVIPSWRCLGHSGEIYL